MSLILTVDGDRWREHLRSVEESTPGIVPVAKGNGYGLGLASLARRCGWLGVDTLAVGTYDELPAVADRFGGDLLVLTPWRPWVPALPAGLVDRVIHTVSRPEDADALAVLAPGSRVVLERLTSMRRYGMSAAELWDLAPTARRRLRVEGISIHLPMQGANEPEARRLLEDVVGAEETRVWVSHLTEAELHRLRTSYPDLVIRPRIGTRLWLGDREAMQVSATVQDVHPLERGDRVGYRQQRAQAGHLLIASGGTAHGLGMVAPAGDTSARGRAVALAKGGLEAAGRLRSPYRWQGRSLDFAEPPHMQASMLLLPSGASVPAVGDSLEVTVRFTATTFDEIRLS